MLDDDIPAIAAFSGHLIVGRPSARVMRVLADEDREPHFGGSAVIFRTWRDTCYIAGS